MNTINLGDLIVFNATNGGWFSTLQRFFTNKPYTHVAVGIGKVANLDSVFEAREVMSVQPWINVTINKSIEYEVYEIAPEYKEKIQKIIISSYPEYAEATYGYLQLLHFVYQWFMRKVFKKDTRRSHNWFVHGIICSEYGYVILDRLDIPEIRNFLYEWNSNNFNAGDMADVLHKFPNIFNLKFKYKL